MSACRNNLLVSVPRYCVAKVCVTAAGFFTISFIEDAVSVLSVVRGHSDSGLYRNSGPFHHRVSFTKSIAFIPREGRSAGFSTPGQCLQESCGVLSRISFTLVITYCFHGLEFFIQYNTVIESTQFMVSMVCVSCNAFLTVVSSRTRIFAPNNSNLGMLCVFNGATFVFAAIKFTST